MAKKILKGVVLALMGFILTGCSSFSGLRTPLYDGQPVEVDEEKIAAFNQSREVIGGEKEFYIREEFSEELLNASLDYPEQDPVLLEEGTYTIGEDIPAGRVTIFGERYSPASQADADEIWVHGPPQPSDYRVGTMFVRDVDDALYFEHMFHPTYGSNLAQVDFISGHTIEIIGQKPGFVAFYAPEVPEDPYVFDDTVEEMELSAEEAAEYEAREAEIQAELEAAGVFQQTEQDQPLTVSEDGRVVEIRSGIYEVGVHFDPGTYEITGQLAPTHTEIYLFREGEETHVFEIAENLLNNPLSVPLTPGEYTLELEAGDKIYPSYVEFIELTKIE